MERHFERDLEKLKERLLWMGSLAERSVYQAVHAVLEADENLATLSIKDFGIGIAPEHQARIFERFERAVTGQHYGGLGLGLWIVRQIVEALGGNISVQSEPGQGSLFVVSIPRLPRQGSASGNTSQ